MDKFYYLQLLDDDNELLQAEDLHLGEFPTFSVHFDGYLGDFFSTSVQDPCDPKSSKTETNENHTKANPEPTQEVDASRCLVLSSDATQELKSVEELDKALGKFYADVKKKRMEMITSWNPLK